MADPGNDEFAELRWLDATDTAAWIRRGDVSAREGVEAAIRRVEAHNGPLNAVVAETFDLASAAVDGNSDDPFFGAPFLVKDLGVSVEGSPYSAGNRAGYRSVGDSGLVQRRRAAGFSVLGRTNSSELGTVPTTEHLAWGPPRNPYHRDYSPGGSSGGSAASVAAGFAPVAHIGWGRLDSSSCHRLRAGGSSNHPGAGSAWLRLPGKPGPGAPPMAWSVEAFGTRQLCWTYWQAPHPGLAPAAECIEAVSRAAKLLREQGHQVELARPVAWDDTAVHRSFSQIVLLTPTMAVPPPALGEVTASGDDPFRDFRRCVPMIAYTAPLNFAGLAAISLPLHTNQAGLPIGVQLVAAYGEEALLLRLARELEVAAPWAECRPDSLAS